MSYSVVWFKRDLRVHDHAPLLQAAAQGPVLCLAVVEPELWAQEDAALQHHVFWQESVMDLSRQLARCGISLQVAVGEVVEVLGRLWAAQPFSALYAHEETGNAFTYARDRAVARWCRAMGVAWHEMPQHGVVRALRNRNTWAARWQQHMGQPTLPAPAPGSLRGPGLPWGSSAWPAPEALGLAPTLPPARQLGGRREALKVLTDFLSDRCGEYRGGISSPLSAPSACSRLSPYLALGCLGVREVVQATHRRMTQLALTSGPEAARAQRQQRGLQGFISRLHWHCHFIQKLESEPELEWRNLHRGYDGLREEQADPARLNALMNGRTGWPLVDACVAMLHHTGWLNFRMRAMLVSVASYPLWLHWRPVGLWLAREFLDYEPGIHWSQMQMQAGTTGINTTRVYNPIKQAQDHDPHGHFVRRWLPALRRVPDTWLLEPWRMPEAVQAHCGVRVGVDIPVPLVDLAQATREAKARVHALRAQPAVRAARGAIVDKHGSRGPLRDRLDAAPGTRRRRSKSSPPPAEPIQQTLDL